MKNFIDKVKFWNFIYEIFRADKAIEEISVPDLVYFKKTKMLKKVNL